MFSRSLATSNDPTGNYINCFVDGGQVVVRKTADDSPSQLSPRIKAGDDIIAIWFDWENAQQMVAFSQLVGYKLTPPIGGQVKSHLPTIHQMSGEEILGFCQHMGVHPAHLIPFQSDPQLSLPAPLLELLLDIKNGKGKFSKEDRELAEVAVSFESKRITRYLADVAHAERENPPQGITLTRVFTNVLDSPDLLKKLVRESIGVNTALKRTAYVDYPLAMRVRNVAFTGLKSQIDRVNYGLEVKECGLTLSLEDVKSQYQLVFDEDASETKLLLFIADVKDGLFEQEIEPRAATIENIEDVISLMDFNGSRLQQIYNYVAKRIGGILSLSASAKALVPELATSVAVHFLMEDRLSKSKHKNGEVLKRMPTEEMVSELFEHADFKEGTLFRRLMDNRVMIALSQQGVPTYPSVTPK